MASNNIGMHFSVEKVELDTNGLLNYVPQVNNKKIESAKLEWIQFYQGFVANEKAQFLTIGNFYNDESTKFQDPPLPQESHSYYFIDSVFVEPFYDPFIPNIITPNGDGKNDSLFIYGIEGRNWELIIDNRWGQRLYYSKGYRNNWNGNGHPPGVYFYHLKQHEIGVEYKGILTITY
jgi:gliding motility-associated-like protein